MEVAVFQSSDSRVVDSLSIQLVNPVQLAQRQSDDLMIQSVGDQKSKYSLR